MSEDKDLPDNNPTCNNSIDIFKEETEVLDWALANLATQLRNSRKSSPPEAFTVFENLVRLKLGQTLGEAVKSDLEDMNARIKHLETATATREWNPLGKTEKIRP